MTLDSVFSRSPDHLRLAERCERCKIHVTVLGPSVRASGAPVQQSERACDVHLSKDAARVRQWQPANRRLMDSMQHSPGVLPPQRDCLAILQCFLAWGLRKINVSSFGLFGVPRVVRAHVPCTVHAWPPWEQEESMLPTRWVLRSNIPRGSYVDPVWL